ncbi:MAG: dihydrodipicolinate synthase family protein, partial [Candidatus Omnitrophica bacterium]|nr:dihydrodipicolinate synthase family protein [Candidatus Omnitrophota bacterium]
MIRKFSGVYTALLTPFGKNGEVDEKRLDALVDFLLKRGIYGFYVCGGTGEGLLMDVAEREKVAELVKQKVGNRVPIITHVGGSVNTENALKLVKHAEKISLDATSSIPPIYYRFSFREIFTYYRSLAEGSSLPLFIYYIPATTGVFLHNEEIARLS